MPRLTEEMIIARSKQSDLASIKELTCCDSNLNDISVVRKLRDVEVLALDANHICSLSDFKECHKLRELYLKRNAIENINDLTYLRQLNNLQKLWLEDNPCVANAGPKYRIIVLRTLPTLKKLDDIDITPEELAQALQRSNVEDGNQKIQAVASTSFEKKIPFSKSEQSRIVFTENKDKMRSTTAQTLTGSKLPLSEPNNDGEMESYNPFEQRKISHPTTDTETLIHLIKGSLGSGILAMPLAFSNAGLWFGLVGTFAIGAICTYCVHILVKCGHILSRRSQVPSLDYADIGETAFLVGPKSLHRWSRIARLSINIMLVMYLLGTCCIYNVFAATNIKQVVEFHCDVNINIRLYILMLLLPLMLINSIRRLKHLAPFSLISNVLMVAGVGITLYYIFIDLPPVTEQYAVAHVSRWPMFFGTVIFAVEGLGVVMSLENNMKNPSHFIGCPGILNIGMAFVVSLYAAFGFLGFLKYGSDTDGSITLNLPVEDNLAQAVKVMIAISIFFTHSLQFYVPMEIIWNNVKGKFKKHINIFEYGVRVGLVTLTVVIAIIIPNLGPFVTLVGAVCLSTLGLIFPAIIETITYWDEPGMGRFNWRLIKNALLVIFGIIGFLTGTYVSIQEIIHTF